MTTVPRTTTRSLAWRLDSLGPGVLVASCCYLALPMAIFLVGWLRWWLAPAALAAMAVPCWETVRCCKRLFANEIPRPDPPRVRWFDLLLLVLVAVVLSALSGMGGYGVQEGDYFKHNAVLRDLIEKPWPVMVASPKGHFPMVYYTAWYLPAAVVGKAAGWNAANHFLFAWGTMGLVLSILWFGLLARRINWVTIALFAAFSGLDVVGAAILKLVDFSVDPRGGWATLDWSRIDWYSLRWWNWDIRWWAGPTTWSYSSNMALLFWVPQQALGGWIATAILLQGMRRDNNPGRSTQWFYLALSAIWSPLVSIGLLPLLAADWLLERSSWPARVRSRFTLPGLCGLALLALMGSYFLARTAPLPFSDDPIARFRFFGNSHYSGLAFLAGVLLFYALEVGALAMLSWVVHRPQERRWRAVVLVSLGFLFVLPFFRYGLNNDLVMRASIPCLMVVALLIARAVLADPSRRFWRVALVVAVVVGATNPVAEVYRHLCEIRRRERVLLIPEPSEVKSLWELNCETYDGRADTDFFFRQYIGGPDAFFFRHLAPRPATAAPADNAPPASPH